MNKLFSLSRAFFKQSNCFSINNLFSYSYRPFTAIPQIDIFNIRDNQGARKKRTIVGRGPGSKLGKTCGKGHKGKQHGYKPPIHIQGGQTPISRLFPKIKYIKDKRIYAEVNIGNIVELVKKGRLNPEQPITVRELGHAGAFSRYKRGIKVLAKGADKLSLCPPLNLVVNFASSEAIQQIIKHKGSITCEHKSRLGLKYLVKPYKFIKPVRDPVITYRNALIYMKLEEKGAKVKFVKPNWMNSEYTKLKERIADMRKNIDSLTNKDLLPEFPVVKSKGIGKGKIRRGNIVRFRKISFDKSKVHK